MVHDSLLYYLLRTRKLEQKHILEICALTRQKHFNENLAMKHPIS